MTSVLKHAYIRRLTFKFSLAYDVAYVCIYQQKTRVNDSSMFTNRSKII